jgi:hypothetical protein
VGTGPDARLRQAGVELPAPALLLALTASVTLQVDKYGSTYEGQFFAGKKEGQGSLVYFNGDKCVPHPSFPPFQIRHAVSD